MIRYIIWVWVPATLFLFAAIGFSGAMQTADHGAAQLEINGGSRGVVPFPHQRHQDTLGDCSICHDVFPQKVGGIDELKAQGTLNKKEIMNKHCIKCHRDRKRAGESYGPTGSCNGCHKRPAG